MRSFIAFFKKELMESFRTGKLVILGVLFMAFGIMNPAIAKLTPWIVEIMSEELADSGMIVTEVTVDALTSWTQFFKNVPMALIAFVFIYGGSFAWEYEKGTLILVLTKGLSRYKVVLAKTLTMLSLWTAGYWLCFGITYGYNAYYWDNSIAKSLLPATVNWWLFGIFTIAVMVLFSVLTSSYSGVLLGTGACILALYLIGLLPKAAKYTPTYLMNGMNLLTGAQSADEYLAAILLSAAASVAMIAASVMVFNKKQI